MLYAAVDGLMRVAPATEEAVLIKQIVLVYETQLESVKNQIALSLRLGRCLPDGYWLAKGLLLRDTAIPECALEQRALFLYAGRSRLHNPCKL